MVKARIVFINNQKTYNMKKFNLLIATLLLSVLSVGMTQAQSDQRTNVGQLVAGLINVNVGAVAVNIGDITLEDLVDVDNVLNNNQVDILRNAIQNNPILSNNSNVLNNLLRDANLITENQIVVGVLTGGQFVIQDI